MILLLLCTIFFSSCNSNKTGTIVNENTILYSDEKISNKSNLIKNDISGEWLHSDLLHKKTVDILKEPKANLNSAEYRIRMFFDNSGSYISYFGPQETKGKWKIEHDILYMKPYGLEWEAYKYEYKANELLIYENEFLIALVRK